MPKAKGSQPKDALIDGVFLADSILDEDWSEAYVGQYQQSQRVPTARAMLFHHRRMHDYK